MSGTLQHLLERLMLQEQSELEAFAAFLLSRRTLKHPNLITDDIPTSELMDLAMRSGSFDWLADEREDLYSLTDGEAAAWPPAS